MIKKILYVAILVYTQSVFCMTPNKKNVIINNKSVIISTDNCCYPVNNDICNLFYAFCKTKTLKKKSFFITKKELTDLQVLNRIINKKVDSVIIKKKWIYLQMIDHVDLIKEMNNNLQILKKNSSSKYHKTAYDISIQVLNKNKKKFEPVNAKGRNVFIGKIRFNIINGDMQHYIDTLAKYNKKKLIYIYNENKKLECQNNTNNNIYSKITTINHDHTTAVVPSTTYIPIPFSSEISAAYKIITSPKTIISTISINNNFSLNYITSTSNILLLTQSNESYNHTAYNRANFNNHTVIKTMHYSDTGIPYNLSSYYYPTHKNKTKVVSIHNHFYKKVIISMSIIPPVLIILIFVIAMYKCYFKSKTKQIINDPYRKNHEDIAVNTRNTDEYHIYEIPSNPNYQKATTITNNNYEIPNDIYNNISSNDSITDCSEQHEYLEVLSFNPDENTIDDCSLTENTNNESDNYNSQINFSDRIYNVLEEKNSAI